MTEEQRVMLEKIKAINNKRLDSVKTAVDEGLPTKEYFSMAPEVTTVEDVRTINAAFMMLDDFSREVAYLYGELSREWGYKRCSVCGMTPQQAKDADYDCAIEC